MADSAGMMYALAIVLIILPIVAIMLLFYARRIKQIALSWDDYLILLALFFTIGTAICMFVGTAIGSLGQHTEIQKDGMPVFDHRLRVFEQVISRRIILTYQVQGVNRFSLRRNSPKH